MAEDPPCATQHPADDQIPLNHDWVGALSLGASCPGAHLTNATCPSANEHETKINKDTRVAKRCFPLELNPTSAPCTTNPRLARPTSRERTSLGTSLRALLVKVKIPVQLL